MSDSDITSADQLEALLDQGKISESEYERLRQALEPRRKGGPGFLSGSPWTRGMRRRELPSLLWVALISLGVMVVLKIAFAVVASPLLLIDAALSAGLLVGIYLGHRWAYVLTIVFCILGTALGFSAGPVQGLLTLVLDCLVLVPVLLCTRYFFQRSANQMGEEKV
jgi:uncharacterized membrane protein